MRDEVLAELSDDDDNPTFRVYCHVSGGFVFGMAKWRYSIFCHELPLALEASGTVIELYLNRTRNLIKHR
jgi:hypothetical protein